MARADKPSKSSPSRRKRGFARAIELVGGNLLVLLIIVLAADLAARALTSGKKYSLFEATDLYVGDRPFIVDHRARGFALQPGFRSEQITITDDGVRGPQHKSDGTEAIVLCIGESTTFGWNVGDDDTYPSRLQASLATDGSNANVINAGVPSYTSTQTLLYLRELLPAHAPQLVIVNEMWNDIWYSSIENWFPEILIWRKPSGWRTWLVKYSALYRLIALRATDEGRDVDVLNEKAIAIYTDNLAAMVAECRKHGAGVVFMVPPFAPAKLSPDGQQQPGQRHFTRDFIIELRGRYLDAMKGVATELDVPVIDHRLSGTLTGVDSLFIDPVHPTAPGNRIMASDLSEYIVEKDLLGQ